MQRASFILGLLVVAASWLGPLPQWATVSFAAHMTLHMAIVAVAAPLLALGMAGGRWDPVERASIGFAPIPASIGELVIVWAWHSPGLHHFARHTRFGFVVEQSMFLAAGLWVWLSAFGGRQPRSRRRSAAGVIGLLLTSMHMTLLGALLAMSSRLLYAHRMHGSGESTVSSPMDDFSPLFDQQLGGCVMLLVGGVVFLAGGLALTGDLLRPGHADAAEGDDTFADPAPPQASKRPGTASASSSIVRRLSRGEVT